MKSIATYLGKLLQRLTALVALVVFFPILLLVAFLLRTNSDEPILLTEVMQGRDGGPRRTYRFRTTGRGTPAFRAIGRFLRWCSIDELPAFWAVVRGEAALWDIVNFGRRK